MRSRFPFSPSAPGREGRPGTVTQHRERNRGRLTLSRLGVVIGSSYTAQNSAAVVCKETKAPEGRTRHEGGRTNGDSSDGELFTDRPVHLFLPRFAPNPPRRQRTPLPQAKFPDRCPPSSHNPPSAREGFRREADGQPRTRKRESSGASGPKVLVA